MTLAFPYTSLITFLAIGLVYLLAFKVGAARGKYEVKAPATTGHPDFERIFRVHYNTLENFVVFVPTLWLFAIMWGDLWAALLGTVWLLGRALYATGYYVAPEKRGKGLIIASAAFWLLLLGALAGFTRYFTGL